MFKANARAEIHRGTTENQYGDKIDDNTTPIATGVLMSLIERTRRTQDEASGTWRTVRYCVGRAHAGTDIRPGDRIVVPSRGKTYVVGEITDDLPDLASGRDLLLDCRIV